MTSSGPSKIPVIVGPTGSGKTGASISLAQKLHGEIISADSRAIYKRMDIGTAKPNKEEMAGVPHWGIDLVNPGERFTAADFQAYAEQKITEITARGHLPIIVGGTGLYVDSLIFGYHFNEIVQKSYSDRTEADSRFLTFGIKWEPAELKKRLRARLDQMYQEPLFEETHQLVSQYGFGSQAMMSNAYQFVWRYLSGELTLDQAKELNLYADYHLAKRQITWFKRNAQIIWCPLDQLESTVLKYIQDE